MEPALIGRPERVRSVRAEPSRAVGRTRRSARRAGTGVAPYPEHMIRICFSGVTGWAASAIVAGIEASADLVLVSGVSRSAAGRPIAEAVGGTASGQVYASVAEALAAEPADVVVDYTSAAAVKQNAFAAVRGGAHVVIGSSGLSAEDYAELDEAARDHEVGVIAAGNFSVMAAVLQKAAALAAEHLDRWEIIDYASVSKPDVPSGTARELAERLGAIRRPVPAVPLGDLQGPVEARGTEVGGARVHSVRLPSYVVSTEIVFGGAGERLVMKHDAGPDPAPYVDGTLLAVRHVGDAVGVRRGLDTLLFGD
ncbi:4-hydroxy-tetrahydrodipicolinate reductase [Catenulispora sp. GP43]|uniref:4-hydroxy-tetrahydrodipicolinate reductase n=1 Tax=Catenulispora sp. GP43 TaxID=3156263 RepID=UPI003514655B